MNTGKGRLYLLPFGLLAQIMTACTPVGWGWSRGGILPGGYASNGQRIYLTGTSANGRISYTGGDFESMVGQRGMMGGGRLACADCHGSDGRGGQHLMHMTVMDAPDIRWATLTSTEHGEHEVEGEMEHPPYDGETFKQALTQGVEPGGDPLKPTMPRWRMSEQDLDDLIVYLETLD